MASKYGVCTDLVLEFDGLCPHFGKGDGCFQDAQNKGAHTASMCRNVASAAEVAGLEAGQLLFSQLAQPAHMQLFLLLQVDGKLLMQ